MHSDDLSKKLINARFKRRETRQMFRGVLSCTDMKTEAKHRYTTQKRLFQLRVQLRVLVLAHERTPLNICRVSRLLKRAFMVFLTDCLSARAPPVVLS